MGEINGVFARYCSVFRIVPRILRIDKRQKKPGRLSAQRDLRALALLVAGYLSYDWLVCRLPCVFLERVH